MKIKILPKPIRGQVLVPAAAVIPALRVRLF